MTCSDEPTDATQSTRLVTFEEMKATENISTTTIAEK